MYDPGVSLGPLTASEEGVMTAYTCDAEGSTHPADFMLTNVHTGETIALCAADLIAWAAALAEAMAARDISGPGGPESAAEAGETQPSTEPENVGPGPSGDGAAGFPAGPPQDLVDPAEAAPETPAADQDGGADGVSRRPAAAGAGRRGRRADGAGPDDPSGDPDPERGGSP